MESATTIIFGNFGAGQKLDRFFQLGDGILIVTGVVKFLSLVDHSSRGDLSFLSADNFFACSLLCGRSG